MRDMASTVLLSLGALAATELANAGHYEQRFITDATNVSGWASLSSTSYGSKPQQSFGPVAAGSGASVSAALDYVGVGDNAIGGLGPAAYPWHALLSSTSTADGNLALQSRYSIPASVMVAYPAGSITQATHWTGSFTNTLTSSANLVVLATAWCQTALDDSPSSLCHPPVNAADWKQSAQMLIGGKPVDGNSHLVDNFPLDYSRFQSEVLSPGQSVQVSYTLSQTVDQQALRLIDGFNGVGMTGALLAYALVPVAAVPEPSTAALGLLGGLVLLSCARARRKTR